MHKVIGALAVALMMVPAVASDKTEVTPRRFVGLGPWSPGAAEHLRPAAENTPN